MQKLKQMLGGGHQVSPIYSIKMDNINNENGVVGLSISDIQKFDQVPGGPCDWSAHGQDHSELKDTTVEKSALIDLCKARPSRLTILIIIIGAILITALLLGIALYIFHIQTSHKRLFVYMIWRHGDRAPTMPVQGIPYDPAIFSNGFGKLTNLGIKQAYQLGESIKKRYFRSNDDYKKNIIVRSTQLNRTIETAKNVLMGIKLEVPIQSDITQQNDSTANPFFFCPRAVEIVSDNQLEEFLHKNFSKIQSLLKKEINWTKDPYLVYDFLYCLQIHGQKLPNWATESVMEDLRKASWYGLERQMGSRTFPNPELKRIRGGSILRGIVEELEKKIQCKGRNCLQFYGLSAHDITLAALFSVFNNVQLVLNEVPHIEYGANVAFELWNINKVYKIKVLYAMRYDKPIQTITQYAPGCETFLVYCDAFSFINASKKLYSEKLSEICISNSTVDDTSHLIIKRKSGFIQELPDLSWF